MDLAIFLISSTVTLRPSSLERTTPSESCAVHKLINSGICPVSGALEAVNALQLGHAQNIEYLCQVIDAEIEQRSVYADVGVDEVAAEERHIIAGTALTSVADTSHVIDLTELAVREVTRTPDLPLRSGFVTQKSKERRAFPCPYFRCHPLCHPTLCDGGT